MSFSTGDHVTWNTPQGTTSGTIVERHTSDVDLAGQTFRASDDDPVFVVESDASGRRAAHKADALTTKE